MPSSSSDSQRLKEDILESDRMSRMQSEERDDRGERESSVCSVSFSVSSATSAQNVKYNSAEEEVDALRYLVRQQKRQIADQESKMRQLQSNMQMTLESKSAAEEAAKNRRNEAELEIKQLKEAIRNAKDTALADCKRLLAHTKEKLLAAEADLDVETKRHSDAFRKSQNELSQTRGDLATALEESDQRRVQMEKETEKLRKAEADIKSQSEQITRLEAFVAQLKLKLSVNIQTVVEQQAKLTASEAKLAAQKTFVQELQAKIGAKDSAIQTMRKKLFDAMQMLPDLDTPRKLKTIFENEMESVLPDIVDITLKNGTYYSDNERRSRAKVEAALRLCEEIEELEASNEQLLQEYEEAVSENTEKIAAVALTTISNASSSSICNPDLGESTTKDADVDLPVRSSPEEFKKQSECYETESRMEAKCSLPEEETLNRSELPTSDLNVQQTCESPKRVTFPDSNENLTPEKQEDQCNNANETHSSSESSPPMQAKEVCKSTEAVTPLESDRQQKQENEKKLNEDKKEKVASAKKVSKSAVPQMQKAKNFTSKQDTGRQASTIKPEPICVAENSSKEEAKKSCDSVAVVDECASEVANAVADAIADAHAGAKAVIEQLENESPPQVAAKDEQLLNSMKKLESLRQRLNQKKAANKLPESTPKESE
uniref:Uncharacterized protein n=1 Tax=Plectus sambesii TaxID=2011161 RepID=A0A914WMT6_9BILA